MQLFLDLWELFQVRQGAVWDALQEHFFLVAVSMTLAVLIAVPLGVLLTSLKRLSEPIIGIAAVAQTIPSLALLGFMLPVLGIGTNNAIFALTVYALLPILRNTYTGILEVDKATVDAGRGLGMTRSQILTKIQLPLALPVIMAGIRTSTVIVIGVATLATFVGAGGLGDIIMRGLAMQNSALPYSEQSRRQFLRLSQTSFLNELKFPHQKAKNNQKDVSSMKKFFPVVLGSTLVLAACGGGSDEDTVVVGGKDFTEQIILTHMVAELIEENTELNVEREENLGNTEILTQGMMDGDIDLYIEYTGTSYITVLNHEIDPENPPTAEEVYNTVQEEYDAEYDIAWLDEFDFENRYSLVMRGADAADVADMSALADQTDELTLGHNANFGERPDGLDRTDMYGYSWGDTAQMDDGLMYDALRNEEVDVIAAFTTDGRIPAYDLEVIADDLNYFPPYYAAPIIMNDTLEAHPELEDLLAQLGPLLTEETMAELNAEVDINAELEEVVARDFLIENGLIDE
ncbi:LOW QUALITY PROTEIN: osmotically activated L-carnitine/choline ABC transporter, permease protein OpuCB [Geomicrobium sp. JCM 19039]|nr:LOW QUALITY PROTEIN: osmotically activated L-carnitine/choline ABC transporter, permease protein OpuCB [Geomicrobium sp. JCM 19039]